MEREEYGGGGRIFKKSVCVKKGEINTHTTPTLIWIGAIPPTYMERESPVQLIFT